MRKINIRKIVIILVIIILLLFVIYKYFTPNVIGIIIKKQENERGGYSFRVKSNTTTYSFSLKKNKTIKNYNEENIKASELEVGDMIRITYWREFESRDRLAIARSPKSLGEAVKVKIIDKEKHSVMPQETVDKQIFNMQFLIATEAKGFDVKSLIGNVISSNKENELLPVIIEYEGVTYKNEDEMERLVYTIKSKSLYNINVNKSKETELVDKITITLVDTGE